MDLLFSVALFLFLMCPSLLRLGWLWVQVRSGKKFDEDDYASGVVIHGLNVVISTGVPGYLFYQATKCGPGCGSGVSLLLLLPVVWAIFFWANTYLSPIEAGAVDPTSGDPRP